MNEIKTPWGSISSKVSLFPLYYLIFIYGLIYILPFGEIVVGSTWFDLLKKEDGPLEWLQFSQYFISSIFGFFILFKLKKKEIIKFNYLVRTYYFLFFYCCRRNKLGRKNNRL